MLVSRLPPRIHAAPAGLYSCPYSYDTRPFVCEACPGNKVFRIWQADARDSGNKIAASAHGMGAGGLAVDAMAIGCLGVERRVERFFSYRAMFVGGSALTELIPVAVNPGNNCLPLPKVIEDTVSLIPVTKPSHWGPSKTPYNHK